MKKYFHNINQLSNVNNYSLFDNELVIINFIHVLQGGVSRAFHYERPQHCKA